MQADEEVKREAEEDAVELRSASEADERLDMGEAEGECGAPYESQDKVTDVVGEREAHGGRTPRRRQAQHEDNRRRECFLCPK